MEFEMICMHIHTRSTFGKINVLDIDTLWSFILHVLFNSVHTFAQKAGGEGAEAAASPSCRNNATEEESLVLKCRWIWILMQKLHMNRSEI